MLPLIEFRVLDFNSEMCGVSREVLMGNAGRAVAEVIKNRFKVKNILVVCGPGNNGGDGFAAAAVLGKEHNLTVCLTENPMSIKSQIAKRYFRQCRKICNVDTVVNIEQLLKNNELIIDAIFGIGLNRAPEGKYAEIIEKINRTRKPVVSVDVPSGFPYAPAIKPDITVTFHDVKEGMNEENSGEIIVKDIGIPLNAQRETGTGEFCLYKVPGKNTHKGENGKVLVIGGGPYTGAPYFAGMAAYRAGVDLVHIFTQKEAYHTLRGYSPLFIVHALADDVEHALAELLAQQKNLDVCLVGPGLGNAEDVMHLCTEFIERAKIPLVVDADAIKLLRKAGHSSDVLVTPHAGEFYELTGEKLEEDIEKRGAQVMKWAAQLGLTILAKGHVDVISDGMHACFNRTGNPGMTVGGTGDVLAGLCAALIAKGCTPYQSARLGAYMNGLAGDVAFEKYRYGLLPTDIIDAIPQVIRDGLEKVR
jgi:NAD(P)H-hydrate epimerase